MFSFAVAPPPTNLPKSGYLRGLDGLRLVAVAIVVLAHYRLSAALPGGFGVTIFFAISGFLISRLLLAEEALKGDISFKAFFVRRFLRLMPPLLIMMALTLPIYLIVEPEAVNWPQIFFAITYLSNLYTVAGLFFSLREAIHEYGPLWSLAVEEHFYLLFPFVLLISRSWKTRVGILIGVVIFSLVLRVVVFATLKDAENFNYYFTLTRLDSIAWGCLLTFALAKPEFAERLSRYRGWKSFAVAVALLLGGIAFRNDFFQDTFRYTIHGIGMALLLNVLVFGKATEPLLVIAEWKPVQIGGRISYEIYLWHQHVIFVMSLFVAPYWVKLPFCLLATAVISYLFYTLSSALTKGLAKRYGSKSVEDERRRAYDKSGR